LQKTFGSSSRREINGIPDTSIYVFKIALYKGGTGYNFGVANALDFIKQNLNYSVIVYDRSTNDPSFILYISGSAEPNPAE
jgi:hypothetical protein